MTTVKQEKNQLMLDAEYLSNPWAYLTEELRNWEKEGVIADFWWRDDDAIKDGPQLQKLLAHTKSTPITLAVIPDVIEDSLPIALKDISSISIAQHGYAHKNHAPADEKKAEFRDHRPMDVIEKELLTGFTTLKQTFAHKFEPMFVPPWNRIGDQTKDVLENIGLDFLSTFTARAPLAGPTILNTHIDPVNWKEGRVFLGEAASLAQVIVHLRSKRLVWDNVDIIEPSGFLTHHAIHDQETWEFIAKFDTYIHDQPYAEWLSLSDYISSFSY